VLFAQNLVNNSSFEDVPDLNAWAPLVNGADSDGIKEIVRDNGQRVLPIKNIEGNNIGVFANKDLLSPFFFRFLRSLSFFRRK